MKGGLYKESVQMYIKADQWESAYSVAVDCMDSGEVKELYVGRARQLEEDNRFKEAERLYLLVHEPDMAISMYKSRQQVHLLNPPHPLLYF